MGAIVEKVLEYIGVDEVCDVLCPKEVNVALIVGIAVGAFAVFVALIVLCCCCCQCCCCWESCHGCCANYRHRNDPNYRSDQYKSFTNNRA